MSSSHPIKTVNIGVECSVECWGTGVLFIARGQWKWWRQSVPEFLLFHLYLPPAQHRWWNTELCVALQQRWRSVGEVTAEWLLPRRNTCLHDPPIPPFSHIRQWFNILCILIHSFFVCDFDTAEDLVRWGRCHCKHTICLRHLRLNLQYHK